MRDAGAYVVVRELHLEIEDEGIRGLVERIVDVLMGDEEGGEEGIRHGNEKLQHEAENSDSDDDKIVPIF